MRRLVLLALAVTVMVAPAGVAAQEAPVVARSDVDKTAIAMGDQVLLTVTVDLAPGYDLLDPGVPRAIGDLEVVDILTALQSRLPSGATRVQLRYLITAFQLGDARLPVIVVGHRSRSGAVGQARTQGEHVIAVRSVVQPGEDTSDIKPLKPPLPVPGGTGDLLARTATAVAIAVALVAAAVLALRVRRRRPLAAAAPGHGPARRTLDELERVAEMRLPEQARTREHYALVSAAIRRYAAERYGLAAEARTARELRRELARAGVGRTQAQLLYELLHDAEAVRYEEQLIYPARAQKAMRDMLELMRKSVVAEEYELLSSAETT